MSKPEMVLLSVKNVIFLSMEMLVFAVLGAALIAGLHAIVQDRILESRLADRMGQEGRSTPAAGRPA